MAKNPRRSCHVADYTGGGLMIVPRTGDALQAQKPTKPQKEIHGRGFSEIFEAECKKLQKNNETITKGGINGKANIGLSGLYDL